MGCGERTTVFTVNLKEWLNDDDAIAEKVLVLKRPLVHIQICEAELHLNI